ncbi:MAG: sigma-70 family RNA polymerase sigma factor [Lachnospiraceae bacterium]|nr:sigma-70 family RNA polymerase sigma factor [Lachnospiraceae bacterium]
MSTETDEFAEVYKAYFDDVFKAVYHRIPNRQMAEDITQDTFFAAFRRGEEFLRHPEPKLWLFRTAHNKILEAYRKTKRWDMEPLELHQELAAQDCYYEVELNLSALAVIGKKGWQVIKAYHVFGNTISEIAESESVTENNMRVRLFRVRKKLRDGMKYWTF